MSNSWVRLLLLFILLVLLQVWLFNKIHLWGIITPLTYIYFILKLPVEMNRNSVLFLSAFLGLTVDLFASTLGLNMLATTVAGFSRIYLLKLFSPRDLFESYSPSFYTFGKSLFLRYAGLMILLHQIVLFSAEALSLFDPPALALRIAGSSTLTLILVFAFEKMDKSKTEAR
ncbi:MAG: rod shape-determining protein MreD [Candidatus Symbiothrix sp.]|jgi:rod shape-determining protein MreD|nr:rod shape-determining protein MreD [Candidatus Symbiothrix sp.]